MTTALAVIAWLQALPRWIRSALAGTAVVCAIGLAWVAWLHRHDHAVIAGAEAARRAREAPARAQADRARDADARAIETRAAKDDAELLAARDRALASDPASVATLAPTSLALACSRLRHSYNPAQLSRMKDFVRLCSLPAN